MMSQMNIVTVFISCMMIMLPTVFSAPVTEVQMVRSKANSRYITWSGSTVTSTSTAATSGNFIVEHVGNDLFLRPYNDASRQLLRVAQSQCNQDMQISSTGSRIHRVSADGSSGGTTGVKIYIKDDSTGEKWYLRINSIFHQVSLECQSSLDNVSESARTEFEFDILLVSTNGL